MPLEFTDKFRLPKPPEGVLDWHHPYYDAMEIIDIHVPRIFMKAPEVSLTLESGGSLAGNWYYYYKIVARKTTIGYTMPSWENIRIFTGVQPNPQIKIDWTAIAGANTYDIYRYETFTPGYEPQDSEFRFIINLAGTTYTDTGDTPTAQIPPTSPTWYVTEIDQKYIVPDYTEADTYGAIYTLIGNLDRIRFTLKEIKGEAGWHDVPATDLDKIVNGKSGGQTFTGGTDASDNLILQSTAHATKGYILLNSDVLIPNNTSLMMKDNGGANIDVMKMGTDDNLYLTNNQSASEHIIIQANSIEKVRVLGTVGKSAKFFFDIELPVGSVINNGENTNIDTGAARVVDTFPDTDGDAVVWHYRVKKGTNLRAGTITAVWDASGDMVEFNEVHTDDIGDTSDVSFSVDISSNNVRLLCTVLTNDWNARVIRNRI